MRATLGVSALAMFVAGAALAGLHDEEEAKLRVLWPLDGSTVLSPVEFIVRVAPDTAPALRVDGEVRPWTLSAGRARVASLVLSAGEHTLSIDDTAISFAVTDDAEAPDIGRAHPREGEGAEACGACHKITEGAEPEVGPLLQPDGCLACHSRTEFDLAHFHPMEPIGHCGECHALHGSPRTGLLRAPAGHLCSACHD